MSKGIRDFDKDACPLCHHKGWCGQRDDGLILCKRPPSPREVNGFVFKGMARDGTTGMYVPSQNGLSLVHAPRIAAEYLPPQKLDELCAQFVSSFTTDHRQRLAENLRLPIEVLDCLPIGWCEKRWWNPEAEQEEGEPGCWTFPEYDARGVVIGIGLRWPHGKKGQIKGSRRGLTLPTGWRDMPDPLLVAEGPTDVIAGRYAGLNVIGRPSNSGGFELLVEVCRDRNVVILGENDKKPDGSWPGRQGAEQLSQRLQEAWDRPVPMNFPPQGHKDLRDFIIDLHARGELQLPTIGTNR